MTLKLTGNSASGSPLLSLNAGTSTRICRGPYGSSASPTGATASLPGFNGERQDPFSGVSHLGNGYRAYSPALYRFTCPDSESPFGIGGINPYAYCNGDPINLTDPSGHGPITLLLRLITRIAIRAGLRSSITDALATATTVTMYGEIGLATANLVTTGTASAVEAGKGNKKVAQSLGWAVLGQVGANVISDGLGFAVPKIVKGIKKTFRGAEVLEDSKRVQGRILSTESDEYGEITGMISGDGEGAQLEAGASNLAAEAGASTPAADSNLRNTKSNIFEMEKHYGNIYTKNGEAKVTIVNSVDDLSVINDNSMVHKFIFTDDDKLLIGSIKKSSPAFSLSHPYLAAQGGEVGVLSAGYIYKKFGRISLVNNSGHYRPGFDTLRPAQEFIKKQFGVNTHKVKANGPLHLLLNKL
ncbi:RHS repeat-associated core domain-containing protein [Salmonella enterica]|nr:RHS repeat-associated core domain-containing protein [Salmonella enterica]EHG9741731.1 RHS repeat-associated core domain-containing protein [Salmonella enterica]